MLFQKRHALEYIIQEKEPKQRQEAVRYPVQECFPDSHPNLETLPGESQKHDTTEKVPEMNRKNSEKTRCHYTEKEVRYRPHIEQSAPTIPFGIPTFSHAPTLSPSGNRCKKAPRYFLSDLLLIEELALLIVLRNSLIALFDQIIIVRNTLLELCYEPVI